MKVCIFVANPCIADSRVLRQADTFARAGYETVIVAVKRSREPFVERRDGFEIRRVLATRGGARALSVSRHRMKAAASAVRASDLDDLQLPNAMPSDEIASRSMSFGRWIRWIRTGEGTFPRSSRGTESTVAERIVVMFRVLAGAPTLVLRRARPVVMGIGPIRRPLKRVKQWQRQGNLLMRAKLLRGQRTLEKQMARAGIEFRADLYWANDANTLRAGFKAARKTGARLFYDAHEAIWDAVAWSRIARYRMARIERRFVGRADAVFTVCRPIAEAMTKRYAIHPPKVVLNCPRLDHTRSAPPHDRSPLNEVRNPGESLILFHGGLSPWRGLEQLVQSVTLLPPQFRLVFMGPGRIRDSLKSLAEDLGVGGRVTFIPGVSPADLPAWLTGADVGVIPYQRRGKNHEYSTPNKLFECMHAGVPLVVNDLPEIRRIVTEVGFGIVTDCSDPAMIAKAIQEVIEDPDLRAAMSARALAAAEEYSWERQEAIMLDAARAVVPSPS